MVRVSHNGDKVIVDLGDRVRDVLLTCGQAEDLEQALRRLANVAELAAPELVRGEMWDVKVESYDGCVAVRFVPPFAGNATRVPIPFDVARKLADLVRFKREQAAYRMRFVFKGVTG